MNLPNFLIIGAAKSGTTSLYNYLRKHPSIYLSPIKETNFFATNFVNEEPAIDRLDFTPEQAKRITFEITNFEAYKKLFAEIKPDIKAVGEVSPLYMNSSIAAQKIKSNLPNVKLIAILRNPVERAYSGYQMQLRNGKETRDFASNLGVEEMYIKTGFYYNGLKRYFDIFDRNQIKIFLFEQFRQDPIKITQEICNFIGVDDTFVPDTSTKFNQGGVPKNKKVYDLFIKSKMSKAIRGKLRAFISLETRRKIENVISSNLLSKSKGLKLEERETLKEIYKEDILKLENLIDKNLKSWLD